MENPTFDEKRNLEVKIGESDRPNTVSEIGEFFFSDSGRLNQASTNRVVRATTLVRQSLVETISLSNIFFSNKSTSAVRS